VYRQFVDFQRVEARLLDREATDREPADRQRTDGDCAERRRAQRKRQQLVAVMAWGWRVSSRGIVDLHRTDHLKSGSRLSPSARRRRSRPRSRPAAPAGGARQRSWGAYEGSVPGQRLGRQRERGPNHGLPTVLGNEGAYLCSERLDRLRHFSFRHIGQAWELDLITPEKVGEAAVRSSIWLIPD
jgi:hypothetical protein